MDDMKPILAAWIRDARRAAMLSQEELGSRLADALDEERGYTKANISGWETQRHSPSIKQLMAIAKVTGRSLPQQLAPSLPSGAEVPHDEGSINATDPKLHVPGVMRVRAGDDPSGVPIRFIKLKLHAGILGFETEPDEDADAETLPIPQEVIDELRLDPRCLLIAPLTGRSMEPMLFEGDKVAINTADRKPVNRELYAFNFNGEGCIKQLLFRGGQWYLHSLNPDFGPINMRSGDCQIVGRVVYQPGRIVTGRL